MYIPNPAGGKKNIVMTPRLCHFSLSYNQTINCLRSHARHSRSGRPIVRFWLDCNFHSRRRPRCSRRSNQFFTLGKHSYLVYFLPSRFAYLTSKTGGDEIEKEAVKVCALIVESKRKKNNTGPKPITNKLGEKRTIRKRMARVAR